MREVEERSRRVKDIVRNRNYRQAVDVIEREVKRLEADDKPRARVRFPRDDGDIEIDVGGIVDFARSMLPKASIEAEDLQDGGTRRGIKTEKIGSTARGFVDLDEDGNPKGFGGTIDSINDANVSVYLGECEQSMSVTIGGKTVTFARNVCEDDKDEEEDDEDEEEDDDRIGRSNIPGLPGLPPGFTGQVCMSYLQHNVINYDGPLGRGTTESRIEARAGSNKLDPPIDSSYFDWREQATKTISLKDFGYTTGKILTDFILKEREKYNLSHHQPIIYCYYSVDSAGMAPLRNRPRVYHRWIKRPRWSYLSYLLEYYESAFVSPEFYGPNTLNPTVKCYWLYEHGYFVGFYGKGHPNHSCKLINNYQPEPPPSLPILPDDMDKNCCEELIKMTREIHKALGVRKLLEKNFQVPSNMMIPEGKGNHVNKDYLEIMSDLFKTIDNYGFDAPVTVTVQDTNKAQKGDQSIELKFSSLGAILKAQTELLIELKGDSANRLNIQVRLAYMMTRMYRTLAKLYYRTSAILDGLGIPIVSKVVTLPIEFNVFGRKHWGAGQGFGKDAKKGQEPKLDLNDEDTTESMLPDLLEMHDYEVEVDEFRAKSNDLYEVLIGIAAKLRS
ncbi:hypothetical protein ACOKW7_21255 [Limnospira platensis CENA597]|uniref:hypothetical protein n=1 Tax=Limnospira platensis TaxID=118562 RepID=UPI003DA03DDA